jgi:hypothetical protein
MKSIINYVIIVLLIATTTSCEKVIDMDLPKGPALPFVDAWITNQPGVQSIRFLKATDYMSPNGPEAISGAQISVTDLTSNTTYPFNYDNGAYTYDAGNTPIGIVGHAYKLSIVYNGETYEAVDTMMRTTVIDSLTYKYEEEDGEDEEGFYAKLYVHDVIGGIDYYWIRTYRNGQLNYHVGEMLSVDGAFDAEGITDGYAFIPVFRDGITSGEHPYQKGDEVKVVIRSVSKETHRFLDIAVSQLYNQGMFAEVLSNVPTNLVNQQAGSTNKIYGWFGLAGETEMSKQIQ